MAIIGPSGCGKSSFLRIFDRMNDLIPGARVEGKVEIDGNPILRTNCRCCSAEKKDRDGLSEAESLPDVHLR